MTHPDPRGTCAPLRVAARRREFVAQQLSLRFLEGLLFDAAPRPEWLVVRGSTLHPPTRRIWSVTLAVQTSPGVQTPAKLDDWVLVDAAGACTVVEPAQFAVDFEVCV